MRKNNKFISNIISWSLHTLQQFSWSKKYVDIILQDKDINELTKGSSIAFLFKFLSLPIGLATSLIISRWYGAEAMGLYGLTVTIIAIIVSLGMLGIGVAMPRLLGETRAKKTQKETLIYTTSIAMIIGSGFFCSLVLFFLSEVIAINIFHETKLTFPLQVTSVFILPLMILDLNTRFLLAAKKVYHSELLTKFIVPGIILCIVFISYWIRPTYFIPIRAYLLACFIGMIASFLIMRKNKYIRFSVKYSYYNRRKILKISGPMMFIALSLYIMNYTDIIMLGKLSSTKDVGVYKIITMISAMISIPYSIISSILNPKMSELYWDNKKRQKLQYVIGIFGKIISYTSLVIGICIMVAGKEILGLFGAEFIIGIIPLYILSLNSIINNMCGTNSAYMSVSGKEKVNFCILVFCSSINIFLNMQLIPQFGLAGAALATSISLILFNIICVHYIWKKDNILTFIF